MASQPDDWVPVERKERKKRPAPAPWAPRGPKAPTHIEEGPFWKTYHCDTCTVRCTSKGDLDIHLSGRKHALAVRLLNGNADETWPCNICHLPFDSALTLTEHNLSKEHATQASRWLTKLGTNAHMAERERHEPWRCYMCDVMCTGQINLQSHVSGMKHKARLAEIRNGTVEQPSRPPAAVPGGPPSPPPSPPQLEPPRVEPRRQPALERPTPLGFKRPTPLGFNVLKGEDDPFDPDPDQDFQDPDQCFVDPDQEFLDQLLGNAAGSSGGVGPSVPHPATPGRHSGRPATASDASFEGSDDRHHAISQGEMSVEDIMQIINGFFRCSLTQATMVDPVVACDGYTYEREAIEAWMQHNRYSPVTKQPLGDRRVMPNLIIKQATLNFQRTGQLS